MTCDFQQCDILTSVDHDANEPVQFLFLAEKLERIFSQLLNSHRIFKRLEKALIRLCVCAG